MLRKLLLSCSQKKALDDGLIPAIHRYDGVMFRLLRRYFQQTSEEIEVYILSAEFGLISHKEKIPFYDRRMTSFRAKELKKTVYFQSKELIHNCGDLQKSDLFINIGKPYFEAFEDVADILIAKSKINLAYGSSGKRLAQMYDWLYGVNSPLRKESQAVSCNGSKAKIKGVEINLNASQIYSLAKEKLSNSDENAFKFQSWFVKIDDLKISPKWLVSQLTGLPVGEFHSDQARKVLQKLGVNVIRS